MSSGSNNYYVSKLREDLIHSLKAERLLKSNVIEEALRKVKREDFLWPGESKVAAYVDEPVPLGPTGQTISAPHMVVIMLEEVDLFPGARVLEVGAGSGYGAALMAQIVSKDVHSSNYPLVWTIERDPDLVAFASSNIRKQGLEDIAKVIAGDGSLGFPQQSVEPIYDRIVVSAGAPFIPPFLEKQLKIGGTLLIPIGETSYQTLFKVSKKKSKGKMDSYELVKEKLMPVMFVPLIGEAAHPNYE